MHGSTEMHPPDMSSLDWHCTLAPAYRAALVKLAAAEEGHLKFALTVSESRHTIGQNAEMWCCRWLDSSRIKLGRCKRSLWKIRRRCRTKENQNPGDQSESSGLHCEVEALKQNVEQFHCAIETMLADLQDYLYMGRTQPPSPIQSTPSDVLRI